MTEKERFAALARTGRFTISELCKDFGISRKIGHKYLHRYESEGRVGRTEPSPEELSVCDGGVGRETDFGGTPEASDVGSEEDPGFASKAAWDRRGSDGFEPEM